MYSSIIYYIGSIPDSNIARDVDNPIRAVFTESLVAVRLYLAFVLMHFQPYSA